MKLVHITASDLKHARLCFAIMSVTHYIGITQILRVTGIFSINVTLPLSSVNKLIS